MLITRITIIILIINFIYYVIKSGNINLNEWLSQPKTKKILKIVLIGLIIDIILALIVVILYVVIPQLLIWSLSWDI